MPPDWFKGEDDLLLSLLPRTLSGHESQKRRAWADVATDMSAEAARLEINKRVYSIGNIRARFNNGLQTRYLQQRGGNENAPASLLSLKQMVDRMDYLNVYAPVRLPPVQAGFRKVANPSLPALESKTDATGPPDDITEYGDGKGKERADTQAGETCFPYG